MPKLWSYLIKKFLINFCSTILGIISLLIVIRFSSIAGFATSGTDITLILKFVGLIIPYVLPIAIPISTLNAALLVSRKFSEEKQYTAMRSSGLALKAIFAPLFIVFTALTLFNFFTIGTLAPFSKIKSKTLVYDTTLKHPLFITQKACPIKIRALYTDIGKMSSKDSACDLVLAFRNKKNERLSLLLADKLSVKDGILQGKNLAIISSIKSSNPNLQDDLIIENETSMSTSTKIVDALLSKDESIEGVDYLDFFQLIKNLENKPLYRAELYKRLNLTLAPISFGFMGLCFGLGISRKSSNISLAIAIGLATLFMITLVSTKSIRTKPEYCLIAFALIQITIFAASFIKLNRIERGRE